MAQASGFRAMFRQGGKAADDVDAWSFVVGRFPDASGTSFAWVPTTCDGDFCSASLRPFRLQS